MFASEGYPLLLGAVGLAALAFAAALRLRSWPWWLAGYVLTLMALMVAWVSRAAAGVPQ
jgi:hypothetical protein